MRVIFKYIIVVYSLFFITTLQAQNSLKVGTIERIPFSYHDENGQLTGFSVELWDRIAKDANLSYNWKESKTFSNLLQNVYDKKTDVAVANISVTSDREKKADFSYSIFESGMAIAVKKGGGISIWKLIADSGLLKFLGIAFLILFVVAHIVWFFERNLKEGEEDYFRDDYRHGIWDAFWWAFVIMTLGGLEGEVSKRLINRVIAGLWIVASIFFISTLTAKITTSMTVAKLQSDIESYRDLKGLRVGVTKGSSHQKFLNSKGISTITYDSLESMYRDLKNGKLQAIVSDYPLLSYYATHDGASWMMITGDIFNKESYGFMFIENSPYLEKVNSSLLKLKESGYYQSLYNKYFGEN